MNSRRHVRLWLDGFGESWQDGKLRIVIPGMGFARGVAGLPILLCKMGAHDLGSKPMREAHVPMMDVGGGPGSVEPWAAFLRRIQ
jgi:hypothetical protein